MNRLPNDGFLINFAHASADTIFLDRCYDLDKQIVDVLVRDSLFRDDCESKLALYQLSQVNMCASRCLDNSFFFKTLFSWQFSLLAERRFEFSLFLNCYPKVCWKVLCDVFPTMCIEKALSPNFSFNHSDDFSEDEYDTFNYTIDPRPKSSYKFKLSFLNEGLVFFQNTLQRLITAEKLELQKQQYEDLYDPFIGTELGAFVDTQMQEESPAPSKKRMHWESDQYISRLSELENMLKKSVSCEEYNLLLFKELGRGQLYIEILSSLPFLQLCLKEVTAINKDGKGITAVQKKLIPEVFSSCHWVVKDKLVDLLALPDNDFDSVDDEFEHYFADDLPKLQEKISLTIELIENPSKNSEDSFFFKVRCPFVNFDSPQPGLKKRRLGYY